jgi:hypothetical protein
MTTSLHTGAVFAVCGLGLGLVQFTLLYRSLRAQLIAHAPADAAVLHACRALLAIFAWAAVVRYGGITGTEAALLGFLVARSMVATRLGRAA